jgi:hypothetical protein
MQTTIGLVIACAVIGILAIGAWFWLTEPTGGRVSYSEEHPGREIFFGSATWLCFLIGVCAMGLCLLLPLV